MESFEDVRDQIAEMLARPEAQRKMDAAVTEINSAMRLYFNKKAIHDSSVSIGAESEVPEPLDLKALGKRLGFEHEVIGPYTVVTIQDEPIRQSLESGTQASPMEERPNFVQLMYGAQTRQMTIPRQPLYSPLRTADEPSRKVYVSWKTAETEAYTPPLEEVRGEVVMAIRMASANLGIERSQANRRRSGQRRQITC